MSVEPEGNTLFIGISYAMLREGYTADEIIEFWQLEDEDQITSIVDSLDFNEDSQYLNEDTEVSDEYYFSQIEYIEEGVLRTLKTLAGKFWRGTKGLVKRGKDKIDDVANKADDGLKTNRSGPDGSKTYKPGGGGTGAADDVGRAVNKGANKGNKIPWKTLGAGAALGYFGPKLLDGGGNNNNGDQKDDKKVVILDPETGTYTDPTKKKDDGNTSVSTQTGADQRPKSPLDTNPYFDNPGLKSYWNTRAKQVRQRAMDGSRNLRNHVEKKDDEIVIIEYLLDNGHADTVEEAVYVFTQLDEDYIASILNENV
tara:strand:+ start:929 stop:1864 length:936 start_codon:yes stop_codon:yes gene_type:complete